MLLAAVASCTMLSGTAGVAEVGAAAAPAAQSSAASAAPAEPIAQIEVTGERAGPRLWRVSRAGAHADHVAWILGTLDPLPRRMSWKSHQVEDVIAQAQEVLADRPSVSGIGPIMAIRLYLQYRRAEKIPDHSTLQSLLP
ncbi:MAG TPA: hypothetical protein VME21_02450, partial [Steroidobacteraceae bacterium]|nr:hypothetical protein [Steroidobacteraceae bacterium]